MFVCLLLSLHLSREFNILQFNGNLKLVLIVQHKISWLYIVTRGGRGYVFCVVTLTSRDGWQYYREQVRQISSGKWEQQLKFLETTCRHLCCGEWRIKLEFLPSSSFSPSEAHLSLFLGLLTEHTFRQEETSECWLQANRSTCGIHLFIYLG